MLHGIHMMLRLRTKCSKVFDTNICSCSVEFCIFLEGVVGAGLEPKQGSNAETLLA